MIFLLVLALAGCRSAIAPRGSVPKRTAIEYDAYGGYATFVTDNQITFAGELIGARGDTIVVLADSLMKIPLGKIVSGRVIVHSPANTAASYLILIPNLMLLTVPKAFLDGAAAVSAIFSVIDLTGVMTVHASERAKVNYFSWPQELNEVMKYARFPYEIPPSIDLRLLRQRQRPK